VISSEVKEVMWTEFIQLRTGSCDMVLYENFKLHKRQDMF
jgi:hypothetical protein